MKTIALDFDGVLHRYIGWRNGLLDEPLPGALAAVQAILAQNIALAIYTTREVAIVKDWLQHYGFPDIPVSNTKPLSIVLLDDRAIRFEGQWNQELIDRLISFKAYWEE